MEEIPKTTDPNNIQLEDPNGLKEERMVPFGEILATRIAIDSSKLNIKKHNSIWGLQNVNFSYARLIKKSVILGVITGCIIEVVFLIIRS